MQNPMCIYPMFGRTVEVYLNIEMLVLMVCQMKISQHNIVACTSSLLYKLALHTNTVVKKERQI